MKATIDGLSLHYEIFGTGEPVLFVHGFPLTGELWRPTVERLESEFRCIVPDLRGHGASEAAPDAGMPRLADDLRDLLDIVGEPRPVPVVGLSMGGYVALELYRRHPERVSALALVDSRAGADTPEAAVGREETARRVLREGSGILAESMVEKLFSPLAPADLSGRWRRIITATSPVGAAAALRGMAARRDAFAMLRELRVPLLVAVGEDDAITPPEEARRMCMAAPLAWFEVISGAGHMTPVEQPERFAGLLRDFLVSWTATAAGPRNGDVEASTSR